MSKDFSPQVHWMVHRRYPEIHLSNGEFHLKDGVKMLYTDEELADRRTHEYLQVMASDIYNDIKKLLSPAQFEKLNTLLKDLVEADMQNKSTSHFPEAVTTWYYNRHDHYYHEPNDNEFMEFLRTVYVKGE